MKLKNYVVCYPVRYYSDEDHSSQHEEACKKGTAELRDELLFKQPESTHLGDCPICMLPLPLEPFKSVLMPCCSKVVCQDCDLADVLRKNETRQYTCAFCRDASITTDEEWDKRELKRIQANDPTTICRVGVREHCNGDDCKAFEYYSKAAELGDADAHYRLALLYENGKGVEKDEEKEIYHLEEAVISGHPTARGILGCNELTKGNAERAVRHWIIAAGQGHDDSIKALMAFFKVGLVEKDDLAAALRAHQAAVDATKSPLREAAEEYRRKWPEL